MKTRTIDAIVLATGLFLIPACSSVKGYLKQDLQVSARYEYKHLNNDDIIDRVVHKRIITLRPLRRKLDISIDYRWGKTAEYGYYDKNGEIRWK